MLVQQIMVVVQLSQEVVILFVLRPMEGVMVIVIVIVIDAQVIAIHIVHVPLVMVVNVAVMDILVDVILHSVTHSQLVVVIPEYVLLKIKLVPVRVDNVILMEVVVVIQANVAVMDMPAVVMDQSVIHIAIQHVVQFVQMIVRQMVFINVNEI